MRNKKHYLKLFRAGSNVGAALIARGVYAARYGHAEFPDHETLSEIIREIGFEDRSRDEAIALVESEKHWRDALNNEPVPPWALQAALDYLVEIGEVVGHTSRGQSWLAEYTGVHDRTVRKWVGGETKLIGPSAKLARMVIMDALARHEE